MLEILSKKTIVKLEKGNDLNEKLLNGRSISLNQFFNEALIDTLLNLNLAKKSFFLTDKVSQSTNCQIIAHDFYFYCGLITLLFCQL